MNNLALETDDKFLNISEVNVLHLLQVPLNEVKSHAINKIVDLYCEVENTKITLKVDIEKIKYAIFTVVENAIKHSKAKSTISILAGLNVNGDFYIRVDDEGGGIEASKLNTIINQQVHDNKATGLSLVDIYMRMHFGSMKIQPGINQATSITLNIPQSYIVI